jgi:hypothetical protein
VRARCGGASCSSVTNTTAVGVFVSATRSIVMLVAVVLSALSAMFREWTLRKKVCVVARLFCLSYMRCEYPMHDARAGLRVLMRLCLCSL